MAQLPPLEGAALRCVAGCRERARAALVDALDAHPGRKTVVCDARLSGPMALVTRTSTLKEHGVEELLGLDAAPGTLRTPTVIYVVRPTIDATKVRWGERYPPIVGNRTAKGMLWYPLPGI